MRRAAKPEELGPGHLARKALWALALRQGGLEVARIHEALPDAEERALFVSCLQLAGLRLFTGAPGEAVADARQGLSQR